jgi:N6-adenosine-specific RNA methylase IME4
MAAANPRRGAFAVRIEDRDYVFVATLGNVARLETALGVALADLTGRLERRSAKDMLEIAVALCGDEALREAHMSDMPRITEAVISALTYGADQGNDGAAPAPA